MTFELRSSWVTPCFENLTKVGWTDAVGVRCQDVTVGVRVNDPQITPLIRAHIPNYFETVDGSDYNLACDAVFSIRRGEPSQQNHVRDYSVVYHNHTRLVRSLEFNEALTVFDAFLPVTVGYLSDKDVFIHAGVVAWRNRAIIIPGRSRTGKSSLVAALVKAGADYVSDETALLRPDGLVGTLRKPLMIRNKDDQKNVAVDLTHLGGKERKEPLEPGLIVMTRFHETAQWNPVESSKGEAVLGLLDNALAATRIPKKVANACEELVRRVPAFKSPRGEADETAAMILSEFDRHLANSQAA